MKNKKKQTAAMAIAAVLSFSTAMGPMITARAQENDVQAAQDISQEVQDQTEQKPKEAAPAITLPESLQAATGTALQEIGLPENWTWADGSTVISEETAEYAARYMADDETYDYIEVEGYHAEGHYVERMLRVKAVPAVTVPNEIPVQSNARLPRDTAPAAYYAGDVEINEANFPDAEFRSWLEQQTYGQDGKITQNEIAAITDMNVSRQTRITDLSGIENFTALTYLNCSFLGITSLDVSRISSLETLSCYETEITSLDVSNNLSLRTLYCYLNQQLKSLTVAGANNLKYLSCGNTAITSLDVSSNTRLEDLYCTYTPLAYLNIGTNANLTILRKPSSTNISVEVTTDTFQIQDIIRGIDKSKVTIKSGATGYDPSTGEVSGYTAGTPIVYEYDCGTSSAGKQTLTVTLTLTDGLKINEANFPDAEFRSWLRQQDYGQDGKITQEEILMVAEIDVGGKTQITDLSGIENFTILQYLDCSGTGITNLDVSHNFILRFLRCNNTEISSLDLTYNSSLTDLHCNNTKISSLNLSSNSSMQYLYCHSNQQLQSLTVTGANDLLYLECHKTALSSLDLSSNSSLKDLNCSNTKISSLDLSSNSSLQYLYCHSNQQLQSLTVTGGNALLYLDCNDTSITSLDLSSNSSLKILDCSGTKISSLDLSHNSSLEDLHCDSNQQLQSLTVAGADALLYLYCYGTGISNLDVSRNSSLTSLDCHNNQQLQSLTVAGADALLYLYCYSTGITSLDLSHNDALKSLDCSDTGISNLNLSRNSSLTSLDCYSTGITSLDLSTISSLASLDCSDTGITSLDLSHNSPLIYLNCYNTGITSLDLSSNPSLKYLDCYSTGITSLDVSTNSFLEYLDCHDTPLAYLNIGTNNNLITLNKPVPSNASIEVKTRTFKIQDKIIGIDISKVSITSGATGYDPSTGVVSGYAKGTPIVYDYNCGTSSAGTQTLTVTLALTGLREDSSITITENLDKIYDRNAVSSTPAVNRTGSTGTVSYKWEKKKNSSDWEEISSAPTDTGTYRVTAAVAEDDNYYSAVSDAKEFTIAQADPSYTIPQDLQAAYGQTLQDIALPAGFTWTDQTLPVGNAGTNTFTVDYTPNNSNYKTVTGISVTITVKKADNAQTSSLSLEGWTFGDTPAAATVGFQYGQPRFLYCDRVDGVYTEAVPTAAGTWYVKAVVDETDNYAGTQSDPVSFQIEPKNTSADSQLYIPDITADTDLDSLTLKDGDKVLVQGRDYDVTKVQDGNKVTVTFTFKGNYTGTLIKTYTADNKEPSGSEDNNANKQSDKDSPETGDTTSAVLWTMLMAFAAGTAVLLKDWKRKKE